MKMNARFNDEAKEQIRLRANIETIVGRYVNLKGHGAVMKGLCPFHKEKTPSFQVNPARGLFYCFGCGKGGDVFKFLQEIEGMDFRETLEMLADETGVELERSWRDDDTQSGGWPPADEYPLPPEGEEPPPDGTPPPANIIPPSSNNKLQVKPRRNELLEIHETAAEFFYQQVKGNKTAVDYFRSRGLTAETVREFRLGFAPAGWLGLCDHLQAKGVPLERIVECGLAVSKQDSGAFYDRFRGRIIFPLCDQGGRVVAFAGRGLDADAQPKYLNSPETLLYRKSRMLYGLHKARQGIREQGFAVIVEGYMDYLTLYQSGITNAAAVSGTALTDEHALLIRRYTKRAALVFDGDRAGQAAARRAVFVLAPANLQVSVLTLTGGDDPDSFVKREGADAFRALLKSAKPAEDFLIDELVAASDGSPQSKSGIIDELMPYARELTDAVVRDGFLEKLALRLGVNSKHVFDRLTKNWIPSASINNSQDYADYYDHQDYPGNQGVKSGGGGRAAIGGLEESFLKILIDAPELIDVARKYIPPDSEIITCPLSANVYSIILDKYARKDDLGGLLDACAENPAAENVISRLAAAVPIPPDTAKEELEQKILLLRKKFIIAQMDAVKEELKICPDEEKAGLMERLGIYGAKLRELSNLVGASGLG